MDISLPDSVLHAICLLNVAGYDAYLVGGCVRDSLLGIEPDDWDIATSATPSEIRYVFSDYHLTNFGQQYGTITVFIQDVYVEITTFRLESDYSDGRHPDSVQYTTSLLDDLRRRDFTINAMAYHPFEGVIDLYHGQEDLVAGVIRCVGEPEKRFHEDALRILRALRFAATLDFAIEPKTEAALIQMAPALTQMSAERISCELTKLLRKHSAAHILSKYRNVFAVVLPEIAYVTDFSLISDQSLHLYARFSAMFWKADVDPIAVRETLLRLRFDKRTALTTALLLSCRDMPLNTTYDLLRLLNRITPTLVKPYFSLREVDDIVRKRVSALVDENACYHIPILAIDGDDVIAAGIPKGPEVGRVLYAVLDAVMLGTCPNRKEDLLKWIEENQKPVQ